MKRLVALSILLAAQVCASQSFSFTYGGRTYTITTVALGHVFTFDSSHWTYEPSVVLPSAQTNNQYVLIFSSGTSTSPGQQAIYATTSSVPTLFPSPPALVLSIGATSNLCDMIDARPYWDGTLWHVYVQALEWVNGTCGVQGYIFEATGPSLGSLSWVYDSGTHAQRIISPYAGGTSGIGEVLQWYNSSPYLGASSVPYVTTFNDWTYVGQDCQPINPNGSYSCYTYCPLCAFNGSDTFGYAGPNGTSPMYFWYYRQTPASGETGQLIVYWPDVILGGSLDAATSGNPGLGFSNPDQPGYTQYSYGVGFYPDPVPFANPNYLTANGGFYFGGPLEGTNGVWGWMSAPRVARNPYGYLDPVLLSPRTWQTYLYYSDSSTKGSGFGVSLLTIEQQ